ncbi:hypothetical protein GCM10020255_104710 [Rhodococcus baikonurensis]
MTASRSAVPRPDAHVHFGVFFQGVNHTTIWSDSASGSQIDFETFRRLVLTAERGLFDAFFLGEGLRLREQNGKILDLDIAGRPDAIAQLAALAGITDKIGLVATQNTTYNEPADLARRLSGLDLLSGGRAGWNAVTTDNAWTGENFRRGGFLDHALRYERAGQFIETARALWDSWADDAISDSRTSEHWSTPGAVGDVRKQTSQFDISVTPTLPRSRQGHPVIFQAGDSPSGRDFAATHADVIFSRHGTHFDGALDFAEDIRARLRRAGRPEDDVKILPSTQIVLAENESEVEEKARWVLEGQFTGQTALSLVGLVWGRICPIETRTVHCPKKIRLPAPFPRHAVQRGTATTPLRSRVNGGRSRRQRTCPCVRSPSRPRSVRVLRALPARWPTSWCIGCATERRTASTFRRTWCRPGWTRSSTG